MGLQPIQKTKELLNSTLDVKDILARAGTTILWSSYKIEYPKEDEKLKEFFDALERNNLMQIFKGGEMELSKYGFGYVGWDIWEGENYVSNPKLKKEIELYWLSYRSVYPAWYQQQEIFSALVYRDIINGIGQPLLQFQVNTPNERKVIVAAKSFNQKMVMGWTTITTPKYLLTRYTAGIHKTDYGRINIAEFFNRNYVVSNLWARGQVPDYSQFTEAQWTANGNDYQIEVPYFALKYALRDSAPTEQLEKDIELAFDYYRKENQRNRTKIISNGLSNQTTSQFLSLTDYLAKNDPQALYALNNISNQQQKYSYAQSLSKSLGIDWENNFLDKGYINVSAGEKVVIDKLQGNFNGEGALKTITDLLEMYFNGAGLDYSLVSTSGSQYENVASAQSLSKKTIETIKAKKELREKTINKMIQDIMYAWFKDDVYVDSVKDKCWFSVISNVVAEQMSNVNNIVALKNINAISLYQTVKEAHPTWNEFQITAEIDRIKEDIEENMKLETKQMNEVNAMKVDNEASLNEAQNNSASGTSKSHPKTENGEAT